MKHIWITALVAAVLAAKANAQGNDLIPFVSWDDLHLKKKLKAGELISGEGSFPGVLKVAHAGPGGATIEILEAGSLNLDPAKTKCTLTARLRHENVDGVGYMELWTCFADGQKFYSRSLATKGRLKSLSGTAKWRDLELPIISSAVQGQLPTKLILNIVLPGKGIVYLGPLALEQGMAAVTWWDDSAGGWIGGIGGSVIGLLGAAIGTLTGLGRGRKIVFALLYLLILLGACGTIAGIIALIQKQPYGVWYPLFLGGLLPLFLGIFLRPTIRKKFEAIEMRKMQAMDGK